MTTTKSVRARTSYVCTECGWNSPKWLGQCRECRAWGTLEEFVESAPGGVGSPGRVPAVATAVRPAASARPIAEVSADEARARSTGVGELDRVLGGGVVPGAVVLLAGEPGVGKSTLLLDVAAKAAAASRERGQGPVLYVTGEESASQVRLRAERIGAIDPALLLAAETELGALLGHVRDATPSLLIVDSIQTIASAQVEGGAGGVTQVRAVTSALIQVAKERAIPVLLVGHVTKDGGIAGPRVLEHLVDVVCQFEGDRHARLRLLRAVKNRYGPTDEVGCFDLGERGIVGLADPSGLFLSAARSEVPGTCATVTLEGRRPMPVEIQALVAGTAAGSPRRTTSGVDHSRVAMALAVLAARLRLDTSSTDVYVSTVGGARAVEPATDLAVAIAVVSAARNLPTPPGLVAFGEVGLTGEVRATVGVQRRLAEAARLGFDRAIVPLAGSQELRGVDGVHILPVAHLSEAVGAALPRS
ncbi:MULTISPECIES: DNA repair protein RadA [unclassified Actinomyces]|uniref:DNA repair protein RadA n=1 Tax=unclassified Actinomyces TaxID=2609248 RepID=UPI0013A6B2CD|nr:MULTISPECIES: DNA repair protein RadA [unclassified Actinomyces]MBW3069411.1 DNA repair protein RadA [Actinomyces sp. 594]NDR54744.1 DNA repair protein RadA [Actinomyces sp. 565]